MGDKTVRKNKRILADSTEDETKNKSYSNAMDS